MADGTLSSSSDGKEVIKDPIQFAIDKGTRLLEPDRASIPRRRKEIFNSGRKKLNINFSEQLFRF